MGESLCRPHADRAGVRAGLGILSASARQDA